jgi:DNA (cytosine-5)-methyltransferase 1
VVGFNKRIWPSVYTRTGFEAPPALVDHVIRYLPRDYELFARLDAGDHEAYPHLGDF